MPVFPLFFLVKVSVHQLIGQFVCTQGQYLLASVMAFPSGKAARK